MSVRKLGLEYDECSYRKFKTRISTSLFKHGLIHHVEDATQEFFKGLLEGKHQHQTIDQFVIDYLRGFTGRKGDSGYEQRRRLNNPEPEESIPREIAPDMGASLQSDRNFWGLISRLPNERDKMIASLFYYWGYNAIEIGYYFKISQSRVCQLVKRIQSCISQRATEKSKHESARQCEEKALGQIPTSEFILGPIKSLAFEKPKEVSRIQEETCQTIL